MKLVVISASALLGLVAAANAQHPGHASHPLMQGQKYYLQVQLVDLDPAKAEADQAASPGKIDVALKLVTSEAAHTLDQQVPLPGSRRPLMLRRFLPKSALEQNVTPDESGKGPAAIDLSLAGPTQSFRRWLLADDPERNRLSSFIGTWRFMAVKSQADRAALKEQFETEFTRPPEIVIRRAGNPEERFAAKPDSTYALAGKAGAVTVKKFFPDCGMDRVTGEATNQSDKRKNPAVLVELESGGVTETRWVFAKFPGFAPAQGHSVPIQVTLDCPIEPAEGIPDFAIVAVGEKLEAWTRRGGATKVQPLSLNEKVSVSGSPYQFSVIKLIPSAQMTESYKKDERGKPALQVEYTAAGGKTNFLWVELGHTRSVTTADGPIMVSFQMREESAQPRGTGHP